MDFTFFSEGSFNIVPTLVHFWGDQTMQQMYGKFEGFPMDIVHCLGR